MLQESGEPVRRRVAPPPSRDERALRERIQKFALSRFRDDFERAVRLGKSPRQAAGDPQMRERLEEVLKVVEYNEEQKRRAGEPYMDIADLHRELGLPPC